MGIRIDFNMIGYLTGTFIDTTDAYILLNVHDVGYSLYVPEDWRAKAKAGSMYSLFVYTHVREDAFELYGFPTNQTKKLFELLLSVSGVGTKTALTIVNYGVHAIEQAVQTADVEFFSSIPRIGKKNAQKIIIELKTKLGGLTDLDLKEDENEQKYQITEALVGMGFTRSEVSAYIAKSLDESKSLEQNIKLALQFFGKRK